MFEFMQAQLDVGFFIINEENSYDPPPVGRDTTRRKTLMIPMRFVLGWVWHDKPLSYPPEPVWDPPARLMELVRIPLSHTLHSWGHWQLFNIAQAVVVCLIG
jgi:hypothetical protein